MVETGSRGNQGLYNPLEDEASFRRLNECRDLCWRYNNIMPSDMTAKRMLLSKIVGETDGTAVVMAPLHCDYGENVRLGRRFFANYNTVLLDAAPIVFGDNVLVGPNCCFTTSGHPTEASVRREGLQYASPITIGDDVWFGAGVTVCPGVTIGSDVVIGAGSVVIRDIPSHVVVAGVPCKPIRFLRTDEGCRK
jgi:acetyltransferase-like isoleucine patch superfamily enzyme